MRFIQNDQKAKLSDIVAKLNAARGTILQNIGAKKLKN